MQLLLHPQPRHWQPTLALPISVARVISGPDFPTSSQIKLSSGSVLQIDPLVQQLVPTNPGTKPCGGGSYLHRGSWWNLSMKTVKLS